MSFDDPLWLQDWDYPARLDRALIEAFGAEGVISGLKVTQRAAGANYSVDVDLGTGIVAGDDEANQGSYFFRHLTKENVAVNSPPGTGSRIDAICIQVLDTQAGAVTGGGDSPPVQIKYVAGTPGASPAAATVPDTALLLANVTVAAGQSSVTNANITDRRSLARTTIVVSASEPTDPIDGLVWLKPQ